MTEKSQGIIEPPLDELLEHVDSKYQLVIFASRRARQINDYQTEVREGDHLTNFGPLVDVHVDDKPLSIALREINEEKLEMKPLVAHPAVAGEFDFSEEGALLDVESVALEPAEADLHAAEGTAGAAEATGESSDFADDDK